MEMNEKDIIEQLISAFQTPYTVECNVRYSNNQIFDAIVYYKTIPYVIVEIKESEQNFQHAIEYLLKGNAIVNNYWSMMTNGRTCCLKGGSDIDFSSYSLDEALRKIKDIQSLKESIDSTCIAEVKDIFTKYEYSEFTNDIELVPTASAHPYIVFESKESEKKLFEKIIGEKFNSYEGKLHKYTSLQTLFESIKTNSYRLNGLAGMNDKSEGYYWDEAVSGTKQFPNETINEYFISSFSKIKDDLTLWRLYGNDGKGVCLTFKLKTRINLDNVVLSKLKYVTKEDNCFKFFKELREKNFVFQDIELWKCLFKPIEYKDEKEYRLIMRGKGGDLKVKESGFYITNDNSIINPYIIFDMSSDDFPLELEEITLGPKCPELQVNVVQLMHLLKNSGLSGIEVSESSVKTYR